MYTKVHSLPHMPFGVAELCDRGLEACPVRGCAHGNHCLTHEIKVHATPGGFTFVYDHLFQNLLWVDADDRQRLDAILRGKRESRMEQNRGAMHEELFRAMRQSIIDGEPDQAREISRRALAEGINPLDAIKHGFIPGLSAVGEQFEQGEMFLPDLVLAGEAMKAAAAILEPEIQKTGTARESLGRVVLGTVKGDIHEIGKTLVATMLSANGFEVHDLGVDVPFDTFAIRARELNADIVGISALLTTTMSGQKNVIEAMERHGLRPRVKVIVGGAPVTQSWAEEIGADGYGRDALAAVALAKSLVPKGS